VGEHLRIRDLTVGFKTFESFEQVLDVRELYIERGEAYGLVGESGAGKTVLALAILGLLRQPPARVEAAELSLEGEPLLSKSAKELRAIRGRRISMIFQDPMSALDPALRCRQATHGSDPTAGRPGEQGRPTLGPSNSCSWSSFPTRR